MRGARSAVAVRASARSAVQCTGGLAPPRCFRRSARRYFGREERESYRLLVLLRVARFSDQMLSSGRHLFNVLLPFLGRYITNATMGPNHF